MPAEYSDCLSRPRLLLLDESEFFLNLLSKFLEGQSVEVVTSHSFAGVEQQVRKLRPQLILMDLGVPGMDGAQACAVLKHCRGLEEIPIILIHSASHPEEAAICREAGCQGILTKPLQRKDVLAMGRKLLPRIERRLQRVICATTVFFRSDSNHSYAASMDLSAGGMFLETDYPGKTGEVLNLAFNLPGQPQDVIDATARVVWHNSPPVLRRPSYPCGFGVEFVELAGDASELIERYVTLNAPLQELVRNHGFNNHVPGDTSSLTT